MHTLTLPAAPSPLTNAAPPATQGNDHAETHKCPYKSCGKFFSKKYNLKAHLRLHTGEQPFECPRPNCNKKFKWRSSLSSHSVWHTRKEQGLASATPVPDSPATGKRPHPDLLATATAPHPLTAKRKRPRASKARPAKPDASAHALKRFPAARTAPPPTKRGKAIPAPVPTSMIAAPQVLDSLAAALSAAMGADPDALPGSPVTSDGGGGDEKSLDCELFSGTMLPPLSTVSEGVAAKMGDELLLHEGDVDAAILADATSVLFPSAPPQLAQGASALQGLDTRFGPFELDNLQSFYLGGGKGEGL